MHCLIFYKLVVENFLVFNFRIPAGHLKIFECQKYSDLRYVHVSAEYIYQTQVYKYNFESYIYSIRPFWLYILWLA